MDILSILKKQINNIQKTFDNFFQNNKEICLKEFIEFRDSINEDCNEALLTWYRSGTGKWALGLDKESKISFGKTSTNRDYSFYKIKLEDIIKNDNNRELKKIMLIFNEHKDLLDQIAKESGFIKEIILNITDFEIPTYKVILEISRNL